LNRPTMGDWPPNVTRCPPSGPDVRPQAILLRRPTLPRPMSDILVVGAGLMGRAVARDLCGSAGVASVRLVDVDTTRLADAAAFIGSDRLSTGVLEVSDRGDVLAAMRGRDVAVSCVPYRHNVALARAAVEAGCSFCDLGGNNDVVAQELALDADARAAGVTIIPDCGLAPGLANVLVADALPRLDRVEEVHIRVGGIPLRPRPPLEYQLVFNPAGLINEYREPCVVVREGEVRTVEPLTEVEELEFPPPFGRLEAFNTSGGTSTLPRTLLGRVRQLDYKTIRYPGHCEKARLLMDLGLFDEEPLKVKGLKVAPRDLLEALLLERLSFGDDDAVLLRVTVTGQKDGRGRTMVYTMIDRGDKARGLTAMRRSPPRSWRRWSHRARCRRRALWPRRRSCPRRGSSSSSGVVE
jgi:lysine 6-dehydrogenase